MRFTISAAAFLAIASRAFAQTEGFDALSNPTKDETITAGSTTDIVWDYDSSYSGTVTLTLLAGASPSTLELGDAIATGIDNSKGSYSWTVDSTLGDKVTYGIKISLDSDPTTFQYSFPFHITASTTPKTDNSSSSSSNSVSTSVATTTASSTVVVSSSSAASPSTTSSVVASSNSTGTSGGSSESAVTSTATDASATTTAASGDSSTTASAGTKTTLASVKSSSTATGTSSSSSSTSTLVTTSGAGRVAAGSFAVLAGVVAAFLVL